MITESDWKRLRQLQPIALDRFCRRVLSEVGDLLVDGSKGDPERYRSVLELMRGRDRELADAFDDLRRSTALWKLARIRSLGLLSEEEFARFGPETREAIRALAGEDRA